MQSLAVEVVVKASIILAAAGACAWALRNRSAAVRHGVWTLAAVGVLLLPFVSSLLDVEVPVLPAAVMEAPVAQVEAPQRSAERSATTEPRADVRVPLPAEVAPLGESAPAGAATTTVPAPTNWGQILLGAWGIVALGLLLRLAAGPLQLARLARRADPVTHGRELEVLEAARRAAGIKRPIRLLQSAWSDVPMTWGVVRPVVLLPEDAGAWSDERLSLVLHHEVAHIRRWDVLTAALARVAVALHWFNPMAWWAEQGIREESERASDDWVLRQGTRASTYAEHLLELVQGEGPARIPATVLPMSHHSRFEGRLLAILQPETDRSSVERRQWIAGGVLAGLLFTSISAAVPVAATAGPGAGGLEAGTTVMEQSAHGPDNGRDATEAWDVDLDDGHLRIDLDEPALDNAADEPQPMHADGDLQDIASNLDRIAGDAAAALLSHLGLGGDESEQEAPLDPRSVAALSRALTSDTDPEVRRTAAWALGQIEDAAAVDALAEALRTDSDRDVRMTAVWALGQIEDRSAVPALLEVLNDSDADLRGNAVWALGQIEAPEAVDGLTALMNDTDADVRMHAIWALGQIESASAVPGLVRALDDAEPKVRSQAAWALGQIESRQAVDGLAGALGDSEPTVRRQAAWALGQIESADAVGALNSALANDSDAQVRSTAAWALGQIEPQAAPQALIDALADDNDHVRQSALWALGQIEDPASVPGVRALLDSPDSSTRRAALFALARVRDQAALEAIAELLQDEDPEVRRAAAAALGGRGGWASPRPRPQPQPRPRPRPQGGS